MPVFDFNTPATVGALGTAVSQINQQVLRQIGVTILNAERQAAQERRTEHGEQSDLQPERGLLNLKIVYTYSLLIHCLQIPRRNQTIQKRSFCI